METLIAFLMLCIVQSDMMWSVLQSKTITYAMLQAEATVVSAAILLFFLSCVVTMLQSRMLLFYCYWGDPHHRAQSPPPPLGDGDQGDQALGREENQFFETSDFPQMLGSRLRRHPAVFVFEK